MRVKITEARLPRSGVFAAIQPTVPLDIFAILPEPQSQSVEHLSGGKGYAHTSWKDYFGTLHTCR